MVSKNLMLLEASKAELPSTKICLLNLCAPCGVPSSPQVLGVIVLTFSPVVMLFYILDTSEILNIVLYSSTPKEK